MYWYAFFYRNKKKITQDILSKILRENENLNYSLIMHRLTDYPS